MTTLYLKYRPQKISELDLIDVREFLSKIVQTGEMPHAFLFEGPRGSGKTSAARIIAKVLNCTNPSRDGEPCNICEQCISITKGTNIDVVELDAASHRGIDDVRLIRESVKLAPAKAHKKVYIIDEAHMLTTEASNALLKTLEEPPDHVVFILATTNPEKLIDTIKSRTVRVNFKKATSAEIVKSLSNVLKAEEKGYSKDVLELISKNVDGSFRDAKKILEELMINNALEDIGKAQDFLLQKSDLNIDELITLFYKKDLKGIFKLLNNAENKGVPSISVYTQIIGEFKNYLFSVVGNTENTKINFTKKDILAIIELFIDSWNRYQNDISEYMPLYISSVKLCISSDSGDEALLKRALDEPENENEVADIKQTVPEGRNKKKNTPDHFDNGNGLVKDHDVNVSGDLGVNGGDGNFSDDLWRRVLMIIRSQNASTEALLRASKPLSFDGRKLRLGVFYKFHKEKLESIPHKICLEDSLRAVTGTDIVVECFLTDQVKTVSVAKEEKTEEVVSQNGKSDLNSGDGDVVLTESEDLDLSKLADEIFGS